MPNSPVRRTRFGMNFYSLFMRALQPNGAPATEELANLAAAGIPFVRFPASGQRAGEWLILDSDPARYWGSLDAIFATAEMSGIKLVPSLFWNTQTLPFHLGETIQAWVDSQSRTTRYAEQYIDTFAQRYDRSPALLMYEFGNELNNWVDLPNVAKFWPRPDITMPSRKPLPGDALTSRDFRQLGTMFAERLRTVSKKGIGMGSDNPRGNAWHLARHSWQLDDRDEYIENLKAITPDAANVLSIHLYPHKVGTKTTAFATVADNLSAMVEAARIDNRTSFLGEFGVPRDANRAKEQRQFAVMMDAIATATVDYAALWNYAPFPMQPDFDVTMTNDRAYQFHAIVAGNT